jgi:hypothetical protein
LVHEGDAGRRPPVGLPGHRGRHDAVDDHGVDGSERGRQVARGGSLLRKPRLRKTDVLDRRAERGRGFGQTPLIQMPSRLAPRVARRQQPDAHHGRVVPGGRRFQARRRLGDAPHDNFRVVY